jgi:hypothetical protein
LDQGEALWIDRPAAIVVGAGLAIAGVVTSSMFGAQARDRGSQADDARANAVLLRAGGYSEEADARVARVGILAAEREQATVAAVLSGAGFAVGAVFSFGLAIPPVR